LDIRHSIWSLFDTGKLIDIRHSIWSQFDTGKLIDIRHSIWSLFDTAKLIDIRHSIWSQFKTGKLMGYSLFDLVAIGYLRTISIFAIRISVAETFGHNLLNY